MALNNGGSFGGDIVADVDLGDVNVIEAIADDSAFTPATSKVFPAGAAFDDTTPDSVDEGDVGVVRMSGNRNQYITIRDSAGNERGAKVDASNQLAVADSAVSAGVGATDDALVDAGAEGSVSAKLRRVTTTLAAISGSIDGGLHAEDDAHTTADKGAMALTVRQDDARGGGLAGASGDYQPLITNEHGILRTQAQQHYSLDECNAVTGWSVLDDATTGNGAEDALDTDLNHVMGTASIEFNKVDGTGHTEAGIQKTLTAGDLTTYHKGGGSFVASMYLANTDDVAYVFLRVGTSAAHYNEWRIDGDELTPGAWNALNFPMMAPSSAGNTGNGWNIASTTYVAIGVSFDGEDDALANIRVDHIAANTGLRTTASIGSEVTSVVNTPNINLHKIRNKAVNVGSGAVGTTGTQRVVLATDDPAVTGIGPTDAALVDAGAVGSVNAKLRRLTTDVATVNTNLGTLETDVEATNTALGTIETDIEATETTLTNIEKCQMGNAAPTIDSYGNAAINAATGARTEIIATPGANKQLWIYGLLLTVDTADVTVTLESAANALSGAMPQADNGGFALEPSGNFAMPFFKCNTNEAFNITMGTGVGDGIVSYAVVSV